MKIKLFPSYKFKKNAPYLQSFLKTHGDFRLSSSGTAALYQILKNNKIEHIFIPNYICSSIDKATALSNVKVVHFEIDAKNLQPSLLSLKNQFQFYSHHQQCAVLWPTYFGFTQDLTDVMTWCEEHGILFINDLAQSFGCSWQGTPLYQQGPAMFFSFSPGKPTTAHLGAIFRSPLQQPLREGSSIYNFFIYLMFYIHRYLNISLPGVLRKLYFLIFNKYYLMNQSVSPFDIPILGGVLERESQESTRKQRQLQFKELADILSQNTSLQLPAIGCLEESNPYKFVFRIIDKKNFDEFKQKLTNNNIEFGTFYKPKQSGLNLSRKSTFNLELNVIELPILESYVQHEYLKKILKEII